MAGNVSFSGLGSGIDFSKLTESILAQQSRPVSQLQSKSVDYTKRSDALKQFNTKLAVLTEAAKALTNQEIGTGRIASSSDTSTVTVSSSSTAGTGSVNLNISRLASSLTQSSRVYAETNTAILAGGATSATFELRKGGASTGTEITVNSLNNTLEALRDAINDADAGVTAVIVDVDGSGTQNKLVLTSAETGAAGRVQLVETTATGTGNDLAWTSVNPAGATTDFSNLDAIFVLNGLSLTRSSNTVSDALGGVTLNLKAEGTATINVTINTTDVEQKLRAFITAYNDVQDFIGGQYNKDSKGRPSGVLAADPTIRTVQQQLRDAIAASSTTNGGALENLTQLGIGRDESGKLTLDGTVLSAKLTSSLSDVKALLAGKTSGETGLANNIYDAYKLLSDDVSGVVQTAITGYQTSIKSLDKSISDQLTRLSLLRTSLNRQFAVADAAINQLNGQGTTLTGILNSLQKSDKK